MFENTAYSDLADSPCLAGYPRARDNGSGGDQRPHRPPANGLAYSRYSPDFYHFQNNRSGFGSYYEDNVQGYTTPLGGNYLSNYPATVVHYGPNVYQVQLGTYIQPGAHQPQHVTYKETRQERQGYSRNYNGAAEYGYDPDGPQNFTRRKKFYKSQIIGMRDWYLVKIKMSRPPRVAPESIIRTTSGRFPNHLITWNCNQGIYFFGAPQYFLGSRTASYGGYLKYSLYYTSTEKTHAILDANIIIGGDSGYMVHDDMAQPPPFVNWRYRVKITEENFTRIDGSAITKKQFMKILSNVTSIYIRASYRPGVFNTRLLNVSLDEIVDGNNYYGAQAPRRAPVQHHGHHAQYMTDESNGNNVPPYSNYYVPREYTAYWSTYCFTNTGILLESADYSMTYSIEGDHGNNGMPPAYDYFPYNCSNP